MRLNFTLVTDDLTNRCWVLTKTHSLRSFTKKRSLHSLQKHQCCLITNSQPSAINTDKIYIIESIRSHTHLTKTRFANKKALRFKNNYKFSTASYTTQINIIFNYKVLSCPSCPFRGIIGGLGQDCWLFFINFFLVTFSLLAFFSRSAISHNGLLKIISGRSATLALLSRHCYLRFLYLIL